MLHYKQSNDEKPWGESLDRLLQEMVAHWDGQISRPSEVAIKGASVYHGFYPTFTSELQGRQFTMGIFEQLAGPSLGWSGPKALRVIRGPIRVPQDSVEYLRILIHVADFRGLARKYSIKITHKSSHRWLDKLLLFIQLSPEFQTGNREFDQRYSVELRSDEDRELLLHREIQESIVTLEPFNLLEISSSWITWSQLLINRKQLDFTVVKGYVLKISQLVDVICSPISRGRFEDTATG